ncbi:TPR_REGION domain-containing protein [Paraburkholderia tropica]|uniref:tetratricopeptide repeat-containing sulfotransferase family protein n=1 Tax=Paraburkholderia tropica TaxID=92647 RepID=UPI001CABB053|nr:tetratricopeptide repeat-containing sulfotransferase family protein [Paraburkholderia tropica]CAG9199883.1 TPR_REGION domain-containing protein [Paraburkholderia tropica]
MRAHAHWNAGQAAQAEQLCQRVLAVAPGQSDALHLLGLMAHAYGKLDLAIEHLQAACRAPQAPAAYHANLAEMCRQHGRLAEAEAAARRAVALDADLVAGWNNLGIVLQETGQFDESRRCLERVVALQPDSAEARNNLGNTWRRLARFDLAEACYREALACKPSYAQAHSNLAFLLSTQGRLDEAAAEARLAIDLDPHLIDAYLNLADVESARLAPAAALRTLDMLGAFAPRHPGALIARAKVLCQFERPDEALVVARDALALAPQVADAHLTLARVLQALGQTAPALDAYARAAELPGALREQAMLGRAMLLLEAGHGDEAQAVYEATLAAFPGSVGALAGRANARRFTRADDPDIALLEAFVADGAQRARPERITARFALGKAWLDLGEAARAFAHFDAGNRLKRASLVYDPAATRTWMARIGAAFASARLDGANAPRSELPVFVIGMPRSGTTLIEQILSSHSQVTGAGELPALRHVIEAHSAAHAPYPACVATLDAAQLARMGEDYLARVEPLAQGRARLIDKMPANFIYAGLVPHILPGARIVHVRRDPVDTCLSCYTRVFSGDQRFSYDQAELGAFYGDYARLMTQLRESLPADRFIEVDYEDVIDDLEGQARRLIDFLGLPWDAACLDFHTNPRVVRTASVSQVRQPLYRSSKGRWHAHAAHLQPLLAALAAAGVKTHADTTHGDAS